MPNNKVLCCFLCTQFMSTRYPDQNSQEDIFQIHHETNFNVAALLLTKNFVNWIRNKKCRNVITRKRIEAKRIYFNSS